MRPLRALVAALAGLSVLLPAVAGAIEIREITTPLGIKAWLVEDKSTPVVALSFSFSGGTATDPAGQAGITDLMAGLLTDGAGSLDAQAFRQRQEDAAASLGFNASLDRLSGSLRVLSANRDEGFELLQLAVTEPRFDPDMVAQRRAQTIASINQAAQRPGSVAGRTLMETLFAGHAYAADPAGTPDGLAAATPELLKKRAAELLLRDGLTVAAVGDIDAGGAGGPPRRRSWHASSTAPSVSCPPARRQRFRRNGCHRPNLVSSSSNGRCRRVRRCWRCPASRATIPTGTRRW